MIPITADLARIVLAAVLTILFGYALIAHYGQGLEEVLKSIMLILVGYWFGSSKGSTDKSATIADLTSEKTP